MTSSPKIFFAEIYGDHLWVHACLILEGKTTAGCSKCSNVIHPIDGFHFGNPQYDVQKKLWNSSASP